ncbi:DUF5103 domain-containing protein [Pseudobacter ginsenosidimutans]|uniref:Uncharacterized protein DUF5103 n=1 Tax=Pseudobacter ginsenosidimutans TaxID=661488 RepID=A0A4Q7N1B6_9BACT|nr:DUF5103 domain-containing protein [Pseudobacter ginsenosidimutans]QEC43013.1 DUF5103 domain-containing protein [Pseudobacter ginsenosidimutans]RZS74364.1 uncharacterized protein DUF5103 [Pseudobacter ginsenosidimutans]
MKTLYLLCLMAISGVSMAQIPDAVYAPNIKSVQLFRSGDQLSYPVIRLNSSEKLELHFDEIGGGVKPYSYTFQLCNADWTPALLSQFDYMRGFMQQRINTYRTSSIAFTRYTHYQASLPDQNCFPTRSGNYILRVFLNADTSKTVFTKRFLVVDEKASVPVQIQQPFNGQFFRTGQKVQFKVQLSDALRVSNHLQQVRVAILQNYRWDNAHIDLKPTFFSRNTLEYNTENDAIFPAGKEWRWVDIRSIRFLSAQIASVKNKPTSTDIFMHPDTDRSGQRFNFFRDANGMYTIETTESINPLWQTDYATVFFSYVPKGNIPFPDKDIYLFGQLTGYNLNDSAKMVWNEGKGAYETSLFLKQGYYDYCYVTIDKNDPKRQASFEFTEGNFWESENEYMILVYYRPIGGRADELISVGRVNSYTGRQGIMRGQSY